ncbi:HAD family hydrolase [Paenibacillus flagellatus]|nr:HAD-IA family hydrolase [Paenibacillus flagellatus]
MAGTKAVLFDLFETLISEYADGVRKVDRANRSDAARLGLEHDAYRREWGARREGRMTGAFPDYFAVMRDILHSQNAAPDETVLQAMYEERLREKAAAFRGNDPEVVDMLRELKRAGLRLGLVSNCTEEEVRAWENSELAEWFDDVVFSYRVGCAKPDPAIYGLACERLEVRPGDCLFVGDGGSDELNGAARAGMTARRAVWYLPQAMRERDFGYPQLVRPMEVVRVALGGEGLS